jgi:hypothetical protein
MTTQANPFETLSGAPENKDSENNSSGDVRNTPSTAYSLAKDSIPTDFIGRDGNYSKEEMLALFKPDYALPEEFVFHPMVMTKEAMQPVAFTPDEGRFSGKQSSAFQRGGRGGRGFSTRGGRGGPPRGRGGRGGKLEGHGESKFSAFGREGEAGSWRDKRRERGEDDHEGEDEEYEYHEDGALDKSSDVTDLSESKDDDWDEVKKKKKKKKELDSSMDMKLRHSQEATTKKDDARKEVPTTASTDKAVAPLEKPKPAMPTQATPQPVVEKPTPSPKPVETPQYAPQLTLSAVQDALKQQLEGTTWVYKDSQGIDHGPYPSSKMNEWIMHNFLQADLILRKATDNKWVFLGELILMEQRNPFTGQALAEWVQSGTIPVLLHYQLLQLHQVLVQQQQQQHLPVNMQHVSPLPFNYPNTQHANPSLDQGQPSAVALLQQLQHLAQQTSPAQQAGWQNQGWGSPSPQQRVVQPAYPASPQPSQVHESGLTRKQGVFKIEDLEGASAPKSQKKEESPFSDLWGMNFGSLEKSGADKSQPERADDGNWQETNKPKTKKTHSAQSQPAQSTPTSKKQAQAPQPQQVQPQSPPQQPIVSVVPAPWANAAQNKGTSIKSIQEEDYKDFVIRQQREQQEFEERFKQQQATNQRLATPWGASNPTPASGSSLSKIQEEEMRRKQEEMRRKEQERAGIVEPEPKANWAAKQKPVAKGKPNMREILEEEARERERQKRDGQYSQPAPQPKLGAWASPEKSNMSVREILEEEERMAQMESQKKAQAAPQPQQQANNWANKDSKKQSNYSANANDVPLREVQQQEFKHQQKQTQQPKGGNKKNQSLTSIQQEQLKQRQIQSKNAPVQSNSAWKVNNGQAVSMRDILRQEEAQKGRGSNTNSNQAAAADDDENFWDYNPNQEAANNNAPVVSADEFPALMSSVKKEDKLKQALGGKQQSQQSKGKKKGRSTVDPNLLGFAAPTHEEQ